MITIVKKPKTKKVKLFKCDCGCEFTAEWGDYIFYTSATNNFSYHTNSFSYYTIRCPFCNTIGIYSTDDVNTIEVEVDDCCLLAGPKKNKIR